LPGATRTNAQDGAVYIWIAAGSFSMGSGAEDTLALDGEKPAHPVDVAGFWIMRKEVTNGQYSRCVAAGACSAPSNDHWQDAGYVEHPVTDVDWQQAKRYAEWAGGRLPTEAEWEYACRGTDGRIYPWGNEPPSHALANYDNSEGTKPVGSYPPGANGLYDMAGNVWEWTSSLSKPYPYIAEDGREDAAASGNRALRGGSWLNGGLVVRCAVRYVFFLDLRGDLVGFRVVSPGL
jgi:formylglycine-generating enzyme required for sulfatase activity